MKRWKRSIPLRATGHQYWVTRLETDSNQDRGLQTRTGTGTDTIINGSGAKQHWGSGSGSIEAVVGFRLRTEKKGGGTIPQSPRTTENCPGSLHTDTAEGGCLHPEQVSHLILGACLRRLSPWKLNSSNVFKGRNKGGGKAGGDGGRAGGGGAQGGVATLVRYCWDDASPCYINLFSPGTK